MNIYAPGDKTHPGAKTQTLRKCDKHATNI